MLRKSLMAAAFASAAIAMPASYANAAEITIQAQNPVVELSIFEQIEVEPDLVTISAGVFSDAPTAVEALRRNAADMDRVIAQIKASGIADRDIQTARISLDPQYDYNRTTQRQVFKGYRASNTVLIKLRQIDRAGALLDTLVSSGATNVNGPYFSIEDDTSAKATARERALARGKAQAEQFARINGFSGVRLLQVGEAIVSRGGPAMRGAMVTMDAQAEMAPPPPVANFEPGVVGTGVNLRLSYEMVP